MYGVEASTAVITHCRHQLMCGAWGVLLNDRFMDAYWHGIVVVCSDGVRRRLFPRVFHYSADYPEK